MSNDANVSKRDGFRSRGGFIIACIGSAVGMGNIWRFPTLVSKWGGMTFLLPYFLFVILIGSTGVIGEFALGRAAGAGPVDAFGMCTEARWGKRRPGELVGYIPVLGSLALAIGYTCVMGWIFKYTFLAFDGGLSAMGQDMDGIVATFNATASAWGANVWVVVAVAVSFVIMSFGIAGGIEKANKIMMPILFLLFVGLGIYVATLPGASDGYRYIFTIKPAGLLDPYVWIYAFGQAFFSLSVAGNGSVIYGSYLSKSECIPSSARNVALFDTIAALLAAFVIIPAMAAGGAQLDAGGPGLMFIYLVHVMNGMAGGRIVAMVFFVCVAFAGVTSIINLYEAPVASLQERFGLKRVPATAVIHVIGLAVALCIQAIVSQWMDVVSIYICPLGALLAAVMFFWIGGKKLVLESVNLSARKPIGGWYYPLCKYVYCASVLVALVAGAALGGIGATTNISPALTLGCGAVGGGSSSDNVGPMNLLNIRKVGYGVRSIDELRAPGSRPEPQPTIVTPASDPQRSILDDVRFNAPASAAPAHAAGSDDRFASPGAAANAEGAINEQNVERVIRQVLERLAK